MLSSLDCIRVGTISKTINVPRDCDFDSFCSLYDTAYRQGLKGCTTYRPNPTRGSVLQASEEELPDGPHCCGLDREND